MAVVPWANANEAGDTISKAWADETRKAVVMYEGIDTCASTAGVTVYFDTSFSDIADYAVLMQWQEDPGADGGVLYPEKGTSNCKMCNSGAATDKKFYYCVKGIVGA